MKTAKKHATHGISGFELIDYLLQNVYKYNLTHVEKHVLFQLARCYNPKNKYMFPKQKTIALKINASERSVVRAIQSLVKAGLIIVECNLSNRYAFTSKILTEAAQIKQNSDDEIMSSDDELISQNNDTMSDTCIEPIKEQKKEPTTNVVSLNSSNSRDLKILEEYAVKHNAVDVQAYIADLKRKSADKKIIADYKAAKAAENFAKYQVEDTKKLVNTYKEMPAEPPTESFKALKELLKRA